MTLKDKETKETKETKEITLKNNKIGFKDNSSIHYELRDQIDRTGKRNGRKKLRLEKFYEHLYGHRGQLSKNKRNRIRNEKEREQSRLEKIEKRETEDLESYINAGLSYITSRASMKEKPFNTIDEAQTQDNNYVR